MTLNLDEEATCLAITGKLRGIIKCEDEEGFIDYIRQISPKWDTTIMGILRAYYKEQMSSFEWAMFMLCRYKGSEELVAKFFIAHYQIERGVLPKS